MFFIIGSRNSSNSARLVEVAVNSGCADSMLIHSDSGIPYDKIANCNINGVCSEALTRVVLVKNDIIK